MRGTAPDRTLHRMANTVRLRVGEIRKAKGLTQAALAELADVRRATIAEMEGGKTSRVDLNVLGRIAAALGVDAALLVEQER